MMMMMMKMAMMLRIMMGLKINGKNNCPRQNWAHHLGFYLLDILSHDTNMLYVFCD